MCVRCLRSLLLLLFCVLWLALPTLVRAQLPDIQVRAFEFQSDLRQFGEPAIGVNLQTEVQYEKALADQAFSLFIGLRQKGKPLGEEPWLLLQKFSPGELTPVATNHPWKKGRFASPLNYQMPIAAVPALQPGEVSIVLGLRPAGASAEPNVVYTTVASYRQPGEPATAADNSPPPGKRWLREQTFRLQDARLNGYPLAGVGQLEATTLLLTFDLQTTYPGKELVSQAMPQEEDGKFYNLYLELETPDGKRVFPPPNRDYKGRERAYFGEDRLLCNALEFRVPLEALGIAEPTPLVLRLYTATEEGTYTFEPLVEQTIEFRLPQLEAYTAQRFSAENIRFQAEDYRGVPGLAFSAEVEPEIPLERIEGYATDPDEIRYYFYLELEANGQSAYAPQQAPPFTPLKGSTYQPYQLYGGPMKRTPAQLWFFIPYHHLKLPPGQHKLTATLKLRSRDQPGGFPAIATATATTRMPPLRRCSLSVKNLQVKRIYDFDFGRGLPDTYWAIEVGTEEIFASEEATNEFIGYSGNHTFSIPDGVPLRFVVYDDDVTSRNDLIGEMQLPTQPGPQSLRLREEAFGRVANIELFFQKSQ